MRLRSTRGSNIHNYAQALGWAVVTITTVGYGDQFPVSAAGRRVAVILMVVGIGLIGVITASVASFFIERDSDATTNDSKPSRTTWLASRAS